MPDSLLSNDASSDDTPSVAVSVSAVPGLKYCSMNCFACSRTQCRTSSLLQCKDARMNANESFNGVEAFFYTITLARISLFCDVKSHSASGKTSGCRRRSAAQAIRVNLVEQGISYCLHCSNTSLLYSEFVSPKSDRYNLYMQHICTKRD